MQIAAGVAIAIAVVGVSAEAGVPSFRTQEIERSLKIGYGVILADINADGKNDIVVADKERVLWFENPSWAKRVIIAEGKTKADHVALDAADLDGDGRVEIVLAAGWRPPNTTEASTLQWLKRGASLDEEWSVLPIRYGDPTLHRVRFADLTGNGRPELVVSPLHGKGATPQQNFAEAGPRLGYLEVPRDPADPDWLFHPIDTSKHVMHNFLVTELAEKGPGVLTASYEGVHFASRSGRDWRSAQVGEGNQADPTKSRGAGEVKVGRLKGGEQFVTTIEPFHGREVVAYSGLEGDTPRRTVIDDRLKSGHALWCTDLDGDGADEIVMGFRDPFGGTISFGLNAYHFAANGTWQKVVIDDGGVAVEDLVCGDLNGDGRVDIVAVGRATKNVRIYWNEGTRQAD